VSPEIKIVLTTFDDVERAREVARILVEEALVACAQLDRSPIDSVYRWRGRLESAIEYRLVLKIDPERLERVRLRLLELHPYDTPQFVVIPASASEDYARWVRETSR
jgi:periplasmic divalent cation tolerance protein